MKERRKAALVIWVIVFIGFIIFYNLFSGSRRTTILLILSLLIIYHYKFKKITKLKIAVVLTVLMIFSIFMMIFREPMFKMNPKEIDEHMYTLGHNYIDIPLNPIIMSMDFPYCYNSYMFIIRDVPDKKDFLWGESYAKFIYAAIPRTLWEDKPETISRVVVRNFFPEHYEKGVSMSPTLMGEAYFNFGLIGIALIMLFYGVFCQTLYAFMKSNLDTTAGIVTYGALAPFLFESHRGYFFESTVLYFLVTISIVTAFRLSQKKNSVENKQ